MKFPRLSSNAPQKKKRKWPYVLFALLLMVTISSTTNGTAQDTAQTAQPKDSIHTDLSLPMDDTNAEQRQVPDTSKSEERPDQASGPTAASAETPIKTSVPQEPVSPPATHAKEDTPLPAQSVSAASAESPPAPTQDSKDAKTVYVTPTGKRYHYSSHCNSGTYLPSTLQEALDAGLTPCKKCAGG